MKLGGTIFCLLLLNMLFALPFRCCAKQEAPKRAPKRVALLVGNSKYPDAPLDNPPNDVKALASVLEKFDFTVVEQFDRTKAQFEKDIDQITDGLDEQDVIFCFYAGHGQSFQNANYLIPVDANVTEAKHLKERCVSLNFLVESLEDSEAGLKVMILDKCRDEFKTLKTDKGYSKVEVPDQGMIAYSTAPGEFASDGDGDISPFISRIVEQIQTPRSEGLTLVKLFQLTGQSLGKETGQRPYLEFDLSLEPFWLTKPSEEFANRLFPTATYDAAKEIVQFLATEGVTEFSLAKFKDVNTSVAAGLQTELNLSFIQVILERQAKSLPPIKLTTKSDVKINGKIAIVEDKDKSGTMVLLRVTLEVAERSKTILTHHYELHRSRDLIAAAGFPLNDKSVKETHEDIHNVLVLDSEPIEKEASESGVPDRPIKKFQRRRYFVEDGTRVYSKRDNNVSVEIVAKHLNAKGDPVLKTIEKSDSNFPLVKIAEDELYEVVIHNASNHEVAISLKIDGIDQFTFSEDRDPETGRPKFTRWIVPAKSSFSIPGWHVTSDPSRTDNIRRFLVTNYGEGVSKFVQIPDKSEIGTILVSVSRARKTREGLKSGANAETTLGPPMELKQKVVQRFIDPPNDFIAIRYRK